MRSARQNRRRSQRDRRPRMTRAEFDAAVIRILRRLWPPGKFRAVNMREEYPAANLPRAYQ